jgi:GntR family transcriptional regulator, transcriptional repressor for pyruvate dehydrogenase complex
MPRGAVRFPSRRMPAPDVTAKLIANFKSLIAEGVFTPGGKLPPERELAHRFQVNRSSLRQALKVLQLMGVATQRVGSGTYLNPSATNILREPMEFLILMADITDEELLDARLIVETESAARAAQRATVEDLESLRQAIADMATSHSDTARLEADLAFHEAIFRASGNRVCRLIFTVIHRAILESMARIVKRSDVARPLSFHKQIYAAISSQNAEEAKLRMKEHLLDTKSQFQAANKKARR